MRGPREGVSVAKSILMLTALVVSVMGTEHVTRELFEWGKMFDGLAPSANIKYDCTYNGHPICCGLVNDTVVEHETTKGEITHKSLCKITKVYEPSPYETLHFEMAANLSRISDFSERTKKLVEYIRGDIDASNVWLERVQVHMQSEVVPEGVKEDMEHMSRFIVTKSCKGGASHSNTTWMEWIEPLTIHARNPFSLRVCDGVYTEDHLKKQKYHVEKQNMDHVLIHSGTSLHEETSVTRHAHSKFEAHRNQQAAHRDAHVVTRNYFFDAGTSTFDSSMKWFLCAYLQRKIAFDQDFGFEYTLLEPQDFWKAVPPHTRARYHFFNAPVSAGSEDKDISPLKLIKDVATAEDFVSFKLDIDTPAVEIPMAMELLQTPELLGLVDEFFFELHFRCEVMMYCGWKDKMPQEYNGLQLDRESAMKFFRKFREAGVRSHFWP